MPRSVNHAASKARRKRVLKMAKGYWGARSNVWTIAKNAVEKGLTYAYRDRKTKNATSVHYGLFVSTLELVSTVCLTRCLWANSLKTD